jgi:hypothetical protein
MDDVIRAKDSPTAEIERLWTLDKMNLGPAGYYGALANDENEILAVGAANVLLDQAIVSSELFDTIVRLSRFQSIQLRAYEFFVENFEHRRAEAVLATPLRPSDFVKAQLIAKYNDDRVELERIEIERFFRTGEVEPLSEAATAAESIAGWKRALPLLVDLVLINPQRSAWALRLGNTLRQANEHELLQRFCEIVDKIEIFPNVSLLFRAALAGREKGPDEGLRLLDRVSLKKLPKENEAQIVTIRAELLERAGRFEDAYRAFLLQNKLLRGDPFTPGEFAQEAKAKAAAPVAPAGPDPRTDYFMMLGFPRSGTTLLENALASHPLIETFEEIASFAAVNHLFRTTFKPGQPLPSDFAARARARYYTEIDRRTNKSGAKIFIDKLPILAAQAHFLKKIFPKKRYIFSIRHPYDVVLSCFKQAFSPNIAMDNFTTFEDSCRVYDFTMNQWFTAFDLDSPEVCYVRYDRLVTDLKGEISRALAFLGVGWSDEILHFAERAGERRVKTPSYAKVRAGLSLGVQSSWRNYAFLLKMKEARPLDRWAKLFGYETFA